MALAMASGCFGAHFSTFKAVEKSQARGDISRGFFGLHMGRCCILPKGRYIYNHILIFFVLALILWELVLFFPLPYSFSILLQFDIWVALHS